MFQGEINRFYCPFYAALRNQTAVLQNGAGVPLVTDVALLEIEGLI